MTCETAQSLLRSQLTRKVAKGIIPCHPRTTPLRCSWVHEQAKPFMPTLLVLALLALATLAGAQTTCPKAVGYRFIAGADVPDVYLFDMPGNFSSVKQLRVQCLATLTCSGFTWPAARFIFGHPPGLRQVLANASKCSGAYLSNTFLWGMPLAYEKVALPPAVPKASNASAKYSIQVGFGQNLVGAWKKAKTTGSQEWQDAKTQAGPDYDSALYTAVAPTEFCSCNPDNNNGNVYTPSALSQAPCQSCSAIASATAAAIARLKYLKKHFHPSEALSAQYLGYCLPKHIPDCPSTAYPDLVTKNLKNFGTYFDQCLPYTPSNVFNCTPLCTDKVEGSDYSITFVWDAWENKDVQECINKNGAFYTWYNIFPDFNRFFANPANVKAVYDPAPNQFILGGHAVPVVGYSLSGAYWIVQNSWGPNWGDNGRFRMKMGAAGLGGAGGACISYNDGTSRRKLSSLDLDTFDPQDLINYVFPDTIIPDFQDLFGLDGSSGLEAILDKLAGVLGSNGLGRIGFGILDPTYLQQQACNLTNREDLAQFVAASLPAARGSVELLRSVVCNVQLPSTQLPSTQLPSTQLPSTQLPSTQLPSTQLPSTQLPSVQLPSTQLPSTQLPSVQLPTIPTNPFAGRNPFGRRLRQT